MTTSVIVWGYKDNPPDEIGAVLCWQSYNHGDLVSSVPQYLEDHAERLRAKYLAFIHDLGESHVNGRSVVDHLGIGGGFSYWWMSRLAEKSPLKSPRIYDSLRLMALEEMLIESKPSELIFYSADRDVAQSIQRLCLNLRIDFVWKQTLGSRKSFLSLHGFYHALPHSIQGLGSLRHLASRWSLRKLKKPHWFSDNNPIFLCSYFAHLDPDSCAQGQFYSRQWEILPKHLHDCGRRTNWIQHFLSSPVVPDTHTGIDWLKRFNCDAKKQGYHAFLDAYLTWGIVARALKNWLWLNAVALRLRSIQSVFYPAESAVWLWPILRHDFLTSIKGSTAMNNCLWMELFDAALKDMPRQRTGLYLCENQGWEKAFLHVWRKYGHGEIVGVPHSTVSFWHLYNFDDSRSLTSKQNNKIPLPDYLAVNGMAARSCFEDAGFPAKKLVDVEALRYLYLSGMPAKRNIHSIKHSNITPSAFRPTKINVLILGEMVPISMHNFLRLLEDAVENLHACYSFTFKPHPVYAVDLKDYPRLQASETAEPLGRILGGYDIALATNSTSASVDAYAAGLPVIVGMDGDSLNLSPLRGRSDVSFVSSPEELVDALQNIGGNMICEPVTDDMFFLDSELPRWKRLLGIP